MLVFCESTEGWDAVAAGAFLFSGGYIKNQAHKQPGSLSQTSLFQYIKGPLVV